jgi:hypothetical protein
MNVTEINTFGIDLLINKPWRKAITAGNNGTVMMIVLYN